MGRQGRLQHGRQQRRVGPAGLGPADQELPEVVAQGQLAAERPAPREDRDQVGGLVRWEHRQHRPVPGVLGTLTKADQRRATPVEVRASPVTRCRHAVAIEAISWSTALRWTATPVWSSSSTSPSAR